MNNRDSGLQPERTALSWRRSGWSMLLPALLCLRGGYHDGNGLYVVSGVVLLIGAVMMLCGILQRKHFMISLIVVISSALLITMIVIRSPLLDLPLFF